MALKTWKQKAFLNPVGKVLEILAGYKPALFSTLAMMCLSLVASPAFSYKGNFTDEELAWLSENKEVSICIDPDWLPYEKISVDGKHIGIAADFFQIFSEYTGLTFVLVKTSSWAMSETYAQEGKCQILSFLNESEERSKYLNFTQPYVTSPVLIVTRSDQGYTDGLKHIGKQSLSIVDGYVYQDLIKKDYPEINLVTVDSSDDALRKVSDGEVFSTVGSLFIVTERIQRLGLSNLKIAGPSGYRNEFRVGVRKSEPMLLAIMDKAVASITSVQETEIIQRWVKVTYEHGEDYDLAILIGVISLVILILLVVRSVFLSRYNRMLSEAYELLERHTAELDRISHTDPLTNVPNRLRLDENLTVELNRFQRYRDVFSVLILDIDHFKRVNDEFGHPIGDRVLIELCRVIKQNLRTTDMLGRWGGEEFLVVCSATSKEEALIIAEKLRRVIDEHDFDPVGNVTASFGVTQIQEGDGEKELISRADEALYRAKSEGRNRVCSD